MLCSAFKEEEPELEKGRPPRGEGELSPAIERRERG